MLSLDQLITSSGLQTSSFSADVKKDMDRILQTAGYAALQEVLAILNVRAKQYSSAGTQSAADPAIDARAVADALALVEKKEAEKARRKKILYGTLAGLALIGLGLALWIIRRNKKRHG